MSGGRTATPASRAVQSVTSAYWRFRRQIHEGAKFLIVGGIGLIVVLVGSDAFHFGLGLGKFTSVTIATVVATVATFLGNRHWSFRQRQGAGARSETVTFFLLNGVGLLIQYACIGLINNVLGLSGRFWYTVANLVGVGIGTLFRFWSYRKWIWVQPEVHLARLRRGRHRRGRADLREATIDPAPGTAAPGTLAASSGAASLATPSPAAPSPARPSPAAPSPARPGLAAPSLLRPEVAGDPRPTRS